MEMAEWAHLSGVLLHEIISARPVYGAGNLGAFLQRIRQLHQDLLVGRALHHLLHFHSCNKPKIPGLSATFGIQNRIIQHDVVRGILLDTGDDTAGSLRLVGIELAVEQTWTRNC
jgi:hypothetical protein